jgi:hypothetical protein
MTFESATEALLIQIQHLESELEMLDWAVVQAKPPTALGSSLAGYLNDRVQELRGIIHDAGKMAITAQEQAKANGDFTRLCRALAGCQEYTNQAVKAFYTRLDCADVWMSLHWLAGESETDWAAWVAGVSDGLRLCASELIAGEANNLCQAVLACWQELGDHSRYASVAVNAKHRPFATIGG